MQAGGPIHINNRAFVKRPIQDHTALQQGELAAMHLLQRKPVSLSATGEDCSYTPREQGSLGEDGGT